MYLKITNQTGVENEQKKSALEQGDQTLCMSIAAIDNIAEPHNLF